MSELKPCPCGEVPDHITTIGGSRQKWTVALPDCCSEWMFEFKSQYSENFDEIDRLAVKAWNELPRAAVLDSQETTTD